MSDKRYAFGIAITILYLVSLAVYACVQRDTVLDMLPNEFGDALAGAASPLAFLWLVLGYLQQGEELRQNTKALQMQADELKASVEQQKLLVRSNRDSIAAMERPILNVRAEIGGHFAPEGDGYRLQVNVIIANVGRTHAERVFVHTMLVTLSGQGYFDTTWNTLQGMVSAHATGVRPGVQVPPGETRIVSYSCWLSADEIQRGRSYSDRAPGRLPSVWLLGLVAYDSIHDNRHLTSFSYAVLCYDVKTQRRMDLPDAGPIDSEELVLEETLYGRGPTT